MQETLVNNQRAGLLERWRIETSMRSWTLYLALLLVGYGLLRIGLLLTYEPYIGGDTQFYLEVTQGTLSQTLMGVKPFVAPVFFAIFGNDPTAIMIGQTVVSTVSWSVLAVAATLLVQRPWLKLLMSVGVLFVCISLDMPWWDTVLMSESLAFSLFALFVASWIWLLADWQKSRVYIMLGVSVLWANVRDTNAYVLLALAMCVLAIALVAKKGKSTLLILPVFVALFGFSTISASTGARWIFPFFNIVGQRILPDKEYMAYFSEHGMPVTSELMNMSGKLAASDNGAFYYDPALAPFRDWVEHSGRTTYGSFLVTHPVRALGDPLPEFWLSFAPIGTQVGIALALVLLAAVIVKRLREKQEASKRQNNAPWLVPVVLLVLTYPHVAAAWYGDAQDVDRHVLAAVIQLQLGVVMLLPILTERLLGFAPAGEQVKANQALETR